MKTLRFALLGAGFWSRYQLAAWGEVEGAMCVAICDSVRARAEALAAEFGVSAVYSEAADLFAHEKVDFVDIVASPSAHRNLVELAAGAGVPAICQKPLAEDPDDARAMVAAARQAAVPLLVHENWRWQRPLRTLAEVLHSGGIGQPFRAKLDFITDFPVFRNQPFLADLPRFILADLGTHVLDTALFLFGGASHLFATTDRINPAIRGEDVATVMTRHGACTVVTSLSYASRMERQSFPETLALVEGTLGVAEIAPGCELRVTTGRGTEVTPCAPQQYSWSDPAYSLVHASIVDCHRSLLMTLRGQSEAGTTGADNLATLELVQAAYDSAASGKSIRLTPDHALTKSAG